MAFGKPDMINHRRAIPKKHMEYQDRSPKRDSLNLVQVPHLVEENVTHARVIPPLLRLLGWKHTETTQSENAIKNFFWASFFEKFGPLTVLWGKF